MTPEKEQEFTEKGRINSLASCGAYVAADRLFDASLDACRHYCLEGTVHTTGLAGGFDLLWIQGKRGGKSKLRLNLIREERGRKENSNYL